MFGIFTPAQLHRRRFWDILSRQLEQRGSEYIGRCTFRNASLSASDNVILPALFPSSLDQVQHVPQAAQPIKVSEEDIKEVSERVDKLRI
jgi:hypothetical protein